MDLIEVLKNKTQGMPDEVVITLTSQQGRSIISQLEAERRQREAAETELAELRGQQEPVAVLYATGDVLTREEYVNDKVFAACCKAETPLFTHPPKPVVVLSDCDIGAVSHMAHWYTEEQCEAWLAGVEHAKKQMLAAGIVVNGGE